jgi:hypothetical protein
MLIGFKMFKNRIGKEQASALTMDIVLDHINILEYLIKTEKSLVDKFILAGLLDGETN